MKYFLRRNTNPKAKTIKAGRGRGRPPKDNAVHINQVARGHTDMGRLSVRVIKWLFDKHPAVSDPKTVHELELTSLTDIVDVFGYSSCKREGPQYRCMGPQLEDLPLEERPNRYAAAFGAYRLLEWCKGHLGYPAPLTKWPWKKGLYRLSTCLYLELLEQTKNKSELLDVAWLSYWLFKQYHV